MRKVLIATLCLIGFGFAAVVVPGGHKVDPATASQVYGHSNSGTVTGGQIHSAGGGYSDPKSGDYWWYDEKESKRPWDPQNVGLPPLAVGIPTTSQYARLDSPSCSKYEQADAPLQFQIPDSFWFYGVWYVPGDFIYLSPDGWLSFDRSTAAPTPATSLPLADQINTLMAAYWCDFQPTGTTGYSATDNTEPNCLYYYYDYQGQRLIVEWYQVKLGADPTKIYTFEAWLQFGGIGRLFAYPTCGPYYDTHLIDVTYRQVIGSGNHWKLPTKYLIGIEDPSETKGLTVNPTQLFPGATDVNQHAVRFVFRKVYRYDMAAYNIISPSPGVFAAGSYIPGMVLRYTKIEPIIVAANVGREIATCAITFKIDSSGTAVYQQTRNIFNLYPGFTDTTHFPCWGEPAGHRPAELGTEYQLKFDVSGYASDQCRDNDTFYVYSPEGNRQVPTVIPSCTDTLIYDWGVENYWQAWGNSGPGVMWATGYPASGPTSPTWVVGAGAWIYDLGDPGPDGVYGNFQLMAYDAVGGCNWSPNQRVSKISEGIVAQGTGVPGWNWAPFPSKAGIKTNAYPGNLFIVVNPWVGGSTNNYDFVWELLGMRSLPYPFPHPCFQDQPPLTPRRSATWQGSWAVDAGSGQFGYPTNWGLAGATHLRFRIPSLPPCYLSEPHDVATTHIIEPHIDYVQADSAYNCKSTIANYGYIVEPGGGFFYDHLIIDSAGTTVYHESTGVNKIGTLGDPADDPDSMFITYTPLWRPGSGGDMGEGVPYDLTFKVVLGKVGPDNSDHCPINDELKKTVTALWRDDVGTEKINVPVPNEVVDRGSSHVVKADIRNYGFKPEGPFNVELRIWDLNHRNVRWTTDTIVYSTIQTITFLDWRGNASSNPDVIEKAFPAWIVPTPVNDPDVHYYMIEVRTLLPNDLCPANNFKTVIVKDNGVGIDDNAKGPKEFALSAITPNPFVTTTDIHYAVPVATPVSIKVYDITGTLVRTLVNGTQAASFYSVNWNGVNDRGEKVGQGIYILRMETPGYTATKKFVLLAH